MPIYSLFFAGFAIKTELIHHSVTRAKLAFSTNVFRANEILSDSSSPLKLSNSQKLPPRFSNIVLANGKNFIKEPLYELYIALENLSFNDHIFINVYFPKNNKNKIHSIPISKHPAKKLCWINWTIITIKILL